MGIDKCELPFRAVGYLGERWSDKWYCKQDDSALASLSSVNHHFLSRSHRSRINARSPANGNLAKGEGWLKP